MSRKKVIRRLLLSALIIEICIIVNFLLWVFLT